jgi:hypothetical protein
LHAHPTCTSQEDRFKQCGYAQTRALDMRVIYEKFIPRNDRQRIEKLELFDEFEEWTLFSLHYCIAMAVNLPENNDENEVDMTNVGFLSNYYEQTTPTSQAIDIDA